MAERRPAVFKDPVHGNIAVETPLLIRLIDSRAVQRLKHVRQLGTAFFSYPGAEHSRFAHSLGCMALMKRVLSRLADREGLRLAAGEREAALAAALLHDVGHGAFSHTLEAVLGGDHEAMGARVIAEDPELGRLLGKRAPLVSGYLSGNAKGKAAAVVHDLLSSQLDVDRLDYLARDAHHTGMVSGRVELDRIVDSFTLRGGRLALREKAFLSVEEYFLARYFMYWKVYYHKTSRGMELLLQRLVGRARRLYRAGRLPLEGLSPALAALFQDGAGAPIAAFLDHDDSDVMVAIKAWRCGQDQALADLANRFLTRGKLKVAYEAVESGDLPSAAGRKAARELLERRYPGAGSDYFYEDRFRDSPYDRRRPVLLASENGGLVDLARRSRLIAAMKHKPMTARYYAPEKDLAAVRRALRKA